MPGRVRYSYDVFGRTTILPGIDAVPATATTLSYYADRSTYQQDQGANAQTFNGTRWGGYPPRTSGPTVAPPRTRSPATTPEHLIRQPGPRSTRRNMDAQRHRSRWGTSHPGNRDRVSDGESRTQLANPHGDVVATIDVTAHVGRRPWSSVADYDEYGIVVTATKHHHRTAGSAPRCAHQPTKAG